MIDIDIEMLRTVSSIRKKIFRVNVLTPLLMHGWLESYGNNKTRPLKSEIRTTSIKGVLRYWWRSLCYDCSWQELLKEEQIFFGGSSGSEEGNRSPAALSIENSDRGLSDFSICPHKGQRFPTKGINPQSNFNLVLSVQIKDNEKYDFYNNLIIFTLHLAGFGQRSRRGAGSLQWHHHQWQNGVEFVYSLKTIIEELRKEMYFKFYSRSNGLILDRVKGKGNHPVLAGIWLGQCFGTQEDARKKISEAGHVANSNDKKQLLGMSNPRKASPLHGSIRKFGENYVPVISEVISDKERENESYIIARNKFLEHLGVIV
ncbi:type III-B CRISPR module RAMP protein Cmr1 [Candidatus Contubernalis alkaliaceticus]|uniref:type III-B CRISPR module RAMP protein Cmr1 n=1 Tax=Candidatus Contubernalis alkaliaceticus TaxID=338645 RepID=UPI001F4BE0A2|nr:type III-B CRISPR module RAMP protein Cmr1 [Candidatus Contubernalis alkalaceticus]UNC93169.1 type III-B CRISPR module RAMP protein Cmr1 [Candidatus Contubernalis alkalaceticus]